VENTNTLAEKIKVLDGYIKSQPEDEVALALREEFVDDLAAIAAQQ
jgi:hypothetical protein